MKHIDNLSSLASEYDVIVNCTGLGAKYLCNDRKLVPIRGQVLKVCLPHQKLIYTDRLVYPNFISVVV